MWPWRVKMPTQNLLRLLLLLMLVTRIVLATICGRFGSWGLVKKLNFCSDFEHKVWSRFRSWSKGEIWSWSLVSFFCWCFVEVIWILVEILKLGLANIFKFNFSRDVWDFEVDTYLFEILKNETWSRFLCNLWYELNPRVRCAFGNVCYHRQVI